MDQDHELWRTLRCAGKPQDKASVDTLMLKYRPIAPKPTTTGQPLVGDNNSSVMRRTKRKYVRVSKNNKATCRSKNGVRSVSTDPENSREREDIVTLQLMPERSDLSSYESTPLSLDHPTVETRKSDTWLLVNGGDEAVHPVPVETWVTVESVNAGGSVSHAIGWTDEEIADALDKDTCPTFVSDGSNRVVMVNEAYRRIVTGDGGFERESSSLLPQVIVWLVVDQTAAFSDYRTFTCKVRLEYTWRETKYVKTVPCDVWKMDFGGFAWRLDTTAALTLWL